MTNLDEVVEMPVVVIGAGQSGLATGFYLRRAGLVPHQDFVILDADEQPGGAWSHMWDRLRLFSPAQHSSLPGWPMPAGDGGYPPADHVVGYLSAYETRYDLPVLRPVRVLSVGREQAQEGNLDGQSPRLLVRSADRVYRAQVVVSATGSWQRPFWPVYPGMDIFTGTQIHSRDYRRPEDLAGQRVVIVGGGNTAAQVLAEVSTVAQTRWVTLRPPRFMADDIDGRDLFAAATRRTQAIANGDTAEAGVGGLGDIVMVPSVKEARDRGVLHAEPMFTGLTRDGIRWGDGRVEAADAIIWCTGFRPVLDHLRPLRLRNSGGHIDTAADDPTRSIDEPRLHLVGYGDWTGPASATLIGVGRTARTAAAAISGLVTTGAARP